MGDVIRAMAPARALSDLGHEVDAFIPKGLDVIAARIDGLHGVYRVEWGERWGDRRERAKHWHEAANRYKYFRRGGIRDRYVNLFCPAWVYEIESQGRPRLDRIDVFFGACGLDVGLARAPFIPVSSHEVSWARGWMQSRGIDTSRHVVLFQPHTSSTPRNWPEERWREWIPAAKAAGVEPVLLSANRVADWGCRKLERLEMLTLLRVVAAADLLVVPDSGPLHLASAMGVPAVGLFGPTGGRLLCRHYPRVSVLQGEYYGCAGPCHYQGAPGIIGPCWERGCAAMRTIGVGAVLAATLDALGPLSDRRGCA